MDRNKLVDAAIHYRGMGIEACLPCPFCGGQLEGKQDVAQVAWKCTTDLCLLQTTHYSNNDGLFFARWNTRNGIILKRIP